MKAKEAKARIKINKLLEDAGWRFFDNEEGLANIQLSKGKKQLNDIRSTRTSQIQIWKQTFLVQRILCRYSRKKYQKDTRIHSASIAIRYCQ